ncbi:MAG TPA: helix-turn-helix domain-containing protein [Xanthobacteraceae bacterium]|nr:helix-turn-helix domain-containing protein [Xanthobacteraceae bacterium]
MERKHILKILDNCGGNRTRAAGMLDISVRCLRNKLREYRNAGLKVPVSSSGGQHLYGG